MHLTSQKKKRWLIRHSKLCAARRLNAKRRAYALNRRRFLRGLGVEASRTVNVFSNGQYEVALLTGDARPVPAVLSLSENYEATATFLRELREGHESAWTGPVTRAERRRRAGRIPTYKTYWDFSQIERISPAVALIIAAQYDRIKRKGGWVVRAVEPDKWRPEVRKLLEYIGFFELSGVNVVSDEFVDGDKWRMLRLRSGETVDGQLIGNAIEQLGVRKLIDDPDIYGALIEAIVNTKQHAYPSDHSFRQPFLADWWLTGFVDERLKRVWLAVYDQGVSIPVTLPSWERYPMVSRGLRRLLGAAPDITDDSNDGAAIAVAMAAGRSSTNLTYRGRGLPAMEAAVSLCQTGRMTIYSRCGVYSREKGAKPKFQNRNCALGGTLVVWDMQF